MSRILSARVYEPRSNVICMYPMPPSFSADQYDCLKQLGKPRFIGFESLFAYVEFEKEDESIVKQLISKGGMYIQDKEIRVLGYIPKLRSWDILNYFELLLQPPDQDSPKNILNALNDDCLREIMKKLHFTTLNSIVNVCLRFDRVGMEAFSNKYLHKKIDIFDLEYNRRPTMAQIEHFLIKFGSRISSLSILNSPSIASHNEAERVSLFEMFCRYCKNLNSLELSLLYISNETLYENRPIFEKLKNLRLYFAPSAILDIISVCSKLETLEIHTFEEIDYDDVFKMKLSVMPPKIGLPKLVEARIIPYRSNNHSIDAAINRFIELNTKLKVLEIPGCFNLDINVLSELSELKELKINDSIQMQPTLLRTLSSTNVQTENLELDLTYENFTSESLNILANITNLTGLTIRLHRRLTIDSFIRLLQKLPKMKTLYIKFEKGDYKYFIENKTFLQHTKYLSKLTLEYNHVHRRSFQKFPIDEVHYNEFLELVKNRNNGIKLTMNFIFRDGFQAIHILNMAPDLLTIEQRF
ncbi:uncharacterized protein LOC116350768 [Contarinia nasturtii]|uniref:uncharacterized protein LOC116350768 n=1 Tax=Contarinia nasturtii TaxID=265458 RepID=UPI0012D488FB|nr:uncharacterized protein LOC116350768 [Contarinia nasturtii]